MGNIGNYIFVRSARLSRSAPRPCRSRHSKGFTLIELLVVVSIIALLISILLPSLGKAKEMANRAHCAANLRGIAIANNVYAQDNADSGSPTALFPDRRTATFSGVDSSNIIWNITQPQLYGRLVQFPGMYTNRDLTVQSKMFFCKSSINFDYSNVYNYPSGFVESSYWMRGTGLLQDAPIKLEGNTTDSALLMDYYRRNSSGSVNKVNHEGMINVAYKSGTVQAFHLPSVWNMLYADGLVGADAAGKVGVWNQADLMQINPSQP